MNDISKQTIDKLKIIADIDGSATMRNLVKVLSNYIEETSSDNELGFKVKK